MDKHYASYNLYTIIHEYDVVDSLSVHPLILKEPVFHQAFCTRHCVRNT